jgi:hypothetical protein
LVPQYSQFSYYKINLISFCKRKGTLVSVFTILSNMRRLGEGAWEELTFGIHCNVRTPLSVTFDTGLPFEDRCIFVVSGGYLRLTSLSFIHSSLVLQQFLGPGLDFSFVIFLTQKVGFVWRGISPSQGRYLHTRQNKHRIKAHTNMHVLSGIRNPRLERSSKRRQFVPWTAQPLWWAFDIYRFLVLYSYLYNILTFRPRYFQNKLFLAEVPALFLWGNNRGINWL